MLAALDFSWLHVECPRGMMFGVVSAIFGEKVPVVC